MARAFIGLGSNLGNREENLRAAVEALKQAGQTVVRVSRFIHTSPVGKTDQPDFLNGVLELQSDLAPGPLLKLMLEIERQLGRIRGERWGPRAIDLDLLLYDQQVIRTPDLEVPHPRMHERAFVLMPLAEIAPEVRHPLLNRTAAEMLAQLGNQAGGPQVRRPKADC